jgi:hypothetical protein
MRDLVCKPLALAAQEEAEMVRQLRMPAVLPVELIPVAVVVVAIIMVGLGAVVAPVFGL